MTLLPAILRDPFLLLLVGLTRRRLVAGAAWAAPVVVASSVIPAYAASDEASAPDLEDSTMVTAGDGVKKEGAVLTVSCRR